MDAETSDPLPPEEEAILDAVIEDMPCDADNLKDLARTLRGRCRTFNGTLRVSSQDRVGCFRAQQQIEGSSRKHEEDGYISDDDIVAGIFDMSSVPARLRKSKAKFEVSFGSVTRLTIERGRKRVSCKRVHLVDDTAVVDCRWFEEKMSNDKQATRDGCPVYTLSAFNKEGCNHPLPVEAILSAVRMKYDHVQHEYLLHAEDHKYVSEMANRFMAYHEKSAAARKKQGPWRKRYRKDHDKLKSKRVVL